MTASFDRVRDDLDADGPRVDDPGGVAGAVPSWLDRLTDDEAEPDDATTLALWEGDVGTLNTSQRKTLVVLLKNRFITAAKQPAEWQTLLECETLIRSRLNDLFLDLHLDRSHGVAFKRQAAPEAGGRFPTLLYDTAWGREETILMIFLRARFRSERAEGAEEVIVDRDDLLERVAQFRPAHATDIAGDTNKTARAIDTLVRAGILVKTSDEERLLVSPVIEVLLPVEKLQQLLQWFLADDGSDAPGTADLTGDDDLDEEVDGR
jgi:hypothetical protein